MWKAIETLKGDPGAALAGIVIIAGVSLLTATDVHPYLAVGFPGIIYLLYLSGKLFDNWHSRRMAENDVRRIEAERGNPVRARLRRALDRRRSKNGQQ